MSFPDALSEGYLVAWHNVFTLIKLTWRLARREIGLSSLVKYFY